MEQLKMIERTKTVSEWLELLYMSDEEFLDEIENDNPKIASYTPQEVQEAMNSTLKRLLNERPWAEKEALFGE